MDNQSDIDRAVERVMTLVPEANRLAVLAWVGSVGPQAVIEASDTDILDVMQAF